MQFFYIKSGCTIFVSVLLPNKYYTAKNKALERALFLRLCGRAVCPSAIFFVYMNSVLLPTTVCVYNISTKPQIFFQPTHHCTFLKISSLQSPSWRRYAFLRVRLRNQRFLPHPQKTRSIIQCLFISKCHHS